MKTLRWFILITEERWQIWRLSDQLHLVGEIPVASEQDQTAFSGSVAAWLRTAGYRQEPVWLGLPSRACLATSLSRPAGAIPLTAANAGYELETYLPLTAEDIQADLLADGNELFAVVISISHWKPWLEALELAGIVVQSVFPWTWLVLQGPQLQSAQSTTGWIIWSAEQAVEFWRLNQGRIVEWTTHAGGALALERLVRGQLLRHGPPTQIHLVAEAPDDSGGTLGCWAELSTEQHTIPWPEIIQMGLQSWPRSPPGRTVELRRGALASSQPWLPIQRPLAGALAMLLLLLLTIGGWGWSRSHQVRTAVNQIRQQQISLFQSLFPGQTPPVGIHSRLVSEHTKLKNLQVESGQDLKTPSAVEQLALWLQTIPAVENGRIVTLRVSGERIEFSGVVPKLGDAAVIAEALAAAGLDISGPTTNQLTDGQFAFSMSAYRKLTKSEAVARSP